MKYFSTVVGFCLLICKFGGSEFTCNDGKQIPFIYFCDSEEDCADGEDEISTTLECPECTSDQISCMVFSNRTCILPSVNFVCNESIHCLNHDPCTVGCDNYFECAGTSKCVARSTVCDGNACNGCQEETEWDAGIGFKCVRNAKTCILPQELLHDEVKDCDNGEDYCFKREGGELILDEKKCFECLDGSTIINRNGVCNKVIDCPDLSDECLCDGSLPLICEKVQGFASEAKNLTQCAIGQVLCDGSRCLNRSAVCDGKQHCADAIDEKFDFCGATLSCEEAPAEHRNLPCRCPNQCASSLGVFCNGHAECPAPNGIKWKDGSGLPSDECSPECISPYTSAYSCSAEGFSTDIGFSRFGFLTCEYEVETVPWLPNIRHNKTIFFDQLCDGSVNCPLTQEDESETRCPHRFRCKAGKKLSIDSTQVCDGIPHCDDMADENNTTCPERFFCRALGETRVSIEKRFVCDFNVNCDDSSDEIGCSTDGRFYCETGKPLFVRKSQTFDGKLDCEDWSDECPMKTKGKGDTMFSSRYELIANPFLNALVWIMGILSIGGNAMVLVGEVQTLWNLLAKSDASSSLKVNHLLVLNLAVADMLMGIYLIMLGSADAAYSGVYCKYKFSWLTGTTCKVMGVLVVVSSEVSVITMILLTASRLYAVTNPFYSSSRPKLKVILVLTVLAWTGSFVLALVPFSKAFEKVFVQGALIEDNPFFSSKIVDYPTAKTFVRKMLTYDRKKTNGTLEILNVSGTWSDLSQILSENTNHGHYLSTEKMFGYYSVHSVCMPKLFVDLEDRAWKFSFILTLTNFLAFMFVALSYVAVYVKSQKTAAVLAGHGKQKRNSKVLQQKILRLIITDCCCWVPLCLMMFINLSGVKMPSVTYAIAAIVLLPINSALNPILYSSFMDKYIKIPWKRKPSLISQHTNITATTVTHKTTAHNQV